jgi:ATP-dependent exoDNAse (exonuclease V) beta subunit
MTNPSATGAAAVTAGPGANTPADLSQRRKAIDPGKSIIVQAPAGSGKTTLLTQRYLALLAKVDEPRQIVAITFTIAAAAEMRHRILKALAQAAAGDSNADPLAIAALQHAEAKSWNLLDQPALLRISTIDSFCRELALQQPLLSGLGNGLSIADLPENHYREAARRTLAEIDNGPTELREAISTLLQWRDNGWHELEDQLVTMLGKRDRWMQDFVFASGLDENLLRASLERPFARAAAQALEKIGSLLSASDWTEIHRFAQFACANLNGERYFNLASCNSFPGGPFSVEDDTELAVALAVYQDLASLLMTKDNTFRRQVTKNEGFPANIKPEKERFLDLIGDLAGRPEFAQALLAIGSLPPVHFADDDWRIVRACFVLLRNAAASLKGIFAEVGKVDFIEVAQIAQLSLSATEGAAGEGAFAVADDIHHLLVDEFQDTSRRQHKLLAGLISHWQERKERTCFVVGDPLQSIYFFRDADAELFPRVRNFGLELPDGDALTLELVQLTSNFRTLPPLVDRLNAFFAGVFAGNDGSGLTHTTAIPARKEGAASPANSTHCELHLEFVPAKVPFKPYSPEQTAASSQAKEAQVKQIVEMVQTYMPRLQQARDQGEMFRIAILGRAHKALIPIAAGLRAAGIPFRAIDLEPLAGRPEVRDALVLARALLNKEDRVAWLGVLRAPFCGLSLAELHQLTSADDPAVLSRPVPDLAAEHIHLLRPDTQLVVRRVLEVAAEAAYMRASQPSQTLGAWLETVWLRLGGGACVDEQARSNLDLFWSVLDQLPNGEQDLAGPALTSALGTLKAQPDPAASNDRGVQLMTIHKSKGLEFEIVIIPELQAASGGTRLQMVSWLERGLSEPDESGDLTEFLVAPFQTKGAKGGAAKKWVDRVYRDRERQESRRLLYVAATRARDELHLFARPEYRVNESDGRRSLVSPADNLLATAWPAIESEVSSQFASWQPAAAGSAPAQPEVIAVDRPTLLHRLPPGFTVGGTTPTGNSQDARLAETGDPLYSRESGGVESRVLGLAAHALLEKLALLRITHTWENARAALEDERPRLAAQIRAAGLSRIEAARLTEAALAVAVATSHNPTGQWVLDPHLEADSEVRWTGLLGGEIRNVQADRVFRAGPEPLEPGDGVWWIVDYKTAFTPGSNPDAAVSALRSVFAPQLEVYARVLRQMHGNATTIRAGLYYPRWTRLDWWKIPASAAEF